MQEKQHRTHYLCKFSDLSDLQTKGFTLKLKRKIINIFLVRKKDEVYGYQNECPHARSPLEWKPDEFLDLEKRFIHCTMHGALFEIETGNCVSGPCNGKGLKVMTIEKVSDDVLLVI